MSFLGFVGTSLKFLDNRSGYHWEEISENTQRIGNDKQSKKEASFERLEALLINDNDGVCDLAKYL